MNTEMRHGRYFESGRKLFFGYIPVAELRGTWFQMGRQYGALQKEELVRVLRFAEKNPESSGRTGSGISGLKRFDEFYRGMAETCGLSFEQLRTVCSLEPVRRKPSDGGDPSACAVWGGKTPDGKVLLGRNYDSLPEFAEILDTLVLTVFHPADGANAVAMFNWTGCLYLTAGMNETGLSLNLGDGAFADAESGRIRTGWLLWEFLLNGNDLAALRRGFAACRPDASCLVGSADKNRAEIIDWRADEPSEASGAAPNADFPACAEKYKTDRTLFQIAAVPAEQSWYVKLKGQPEWTEIPLMNLLKGNGELA